MTADRRHLEAQHEQRLFDLARENRDLRAEAVRLNGIIVAVREACRANFAPHSRHGRALAKALGDTP